MKNNTKTNDAVSPVIAVMLMIVVTIIIAAVVSGFVGGMASTSQKTPQVVLQGEYSQANGMTITHASGEIIDLSGVNFMTTPSEMMGTDSGKFAWIVNKTIIQDPSNDMEPIYNLSNGVYNTNTFASGDTLVVIADNCTDYTTSDLGWTKDPNDPPGVNANARLLWEGEGKPGYFSSYAFSYPKNIGKSFYLDMVDTTGNLIARAVVTIKA